MGDWTAVAARLLLYVGVLIAFGDPVVPFVLGNERSAHSPPPRVRLPLGWALTLAALGLMLAAQLASLELAPSRENLSLVLRETAWGAGWAVLALTALTGFVAAGASVGRMHARWRSALLLALAAAFAVAMGGIGHAAADESVWLARSLDAVHVLAAGAWLGTLACLPHHVGAGQWARYSRLAEVAAPVVVLSGVGASWRRLASAPLGALPESPYVWMLAGKIALVLVVLALGARHRRHVRAMEAPGARSVRTELLLAAAVLAVTALLTGTAPPGE